MEHFMAVSVEELGRGSPVRLEIVEAIEDLYHDIARTMINTLRQNERLGKPTVMILPVGPIGQYPRLARICNLERISLNNLWCFFMDEYLTDDGDLVPTDHPLSFRGYVERGFLAALDEDLAPPAEQVIFPDPHDVGNVPAMMEELGGVDACYGGIGINGHIAFNEPPEPGEEMSAEQFAELPTRVLALSRETRTINSVTAADGDIDMIPRMAVTVGMKECLSAQEIRLYSTRPWQRSMIRRVLHGPITAKTPCSLIQTHSNASLMVTEFVAEPPEKRLT